MAWVTFESDAFTLVEGKLTEYRSSSDVVRGFCSSCGTSLTYRNLLRSNEVDVATATLDDSSALAPEYHIWEADKLPWVGIDDGRPAYATVKQASPRS